MCRGMQAYDVSIGIDRRGCVTLTSARARAIAICGGGAFSYAAAEATTRVLSLCGLLK